MFDPKNLVGKHSKQDFEQLLDRIGDAAERIVREETPAPRDPATHECINQDSEEDKYPTNNTVNFTLCNNTSREESNKQAKLRKMVEESNKQAKLRKMPPYEWCGGFPTVEACIKRGYCAKDPNCGE